MSQVHETMCGLAVGIALGAACALIGLVVWLADRRRDARITKRCAAAGVFRWAGETNDRLLDRYRQRSSYVERYP